MGVLSVGGAGMTVSTKGMRMRNEYPGGWVEPLIRHLPVRGNYGVARLGEARRRVAWQGKAWHGKETPAYEVKLVCRHPERETTWTGKAEHGFAGLGGARRGTTLHTPPPSPFKYHLTHSILHGTQIQDISRCAEDF